MSLTQVVGMNSDVTRLVYRGKSCCCSLPVQAGIVSVFQQGESMVDLPSGQPLSPGAIVSEF